MWKTRGSFVRLTADCRGKIRSIHCMGETQADRLAKLLNERDDLIRSLRSNLEGIKTDADRAIGEAANSGL